MDKYTELRDAINDYFPEMRNLTDGAIVETPHWNVFGQCFDGTEECVIFNNCIFNTDDYSNSPVSEIWRNFNEETTKVYRHPMLNDVWRWIKTNRQKHSHKWLEKNHDRLTIEINSNCHITNRISSHATFYTEWDLTKPYLKDQSEEVMDMLIEAKYQFDNWDKKPNGIDEDLYLEQSANQVFKTAKERNDWIKAFHKRYSAPISNLVNSSQAPISQKIKKSSVPIKHTK